MKDKNLWREEGPKAFLKFLTNATGEDYDVAAYDTKYDFDPSNPEAVRFIACVAMSKSRRVFLGWRQLEEELDEDAYEYETGYYDYDVYGEYEVAGWANEKWLDDEYYYPMPNDGSVVPFEFDTNNETVNKMRAERLIREKKGDIACAESAKSYYSNDWKSIYVPHSDGYYVIVDNALHKRDVPMRNMSLFEFIKQWLSDIWEATYILRCKESILFTFALIGFFPFSIHLISIELVGFGIFVFLTAIFAWWFTLREIHSEYVDARCKHPR